MSQSSAHDVASGGVALEAADALVRSYYGPFESRPGEDALDDVLAEDWRNHSSCGYADKAAFRGLVAGLRQAVPDLRWHVNEVIVAGDRVVVRGHGHGTPTASFFGVEPTGRAFSILSIDIHTVRDGRIASSYHLEDWAGAIQQLSAA